MHWPGQTSKRLRNEVIQILVWQKKTPNFQWQLFEKWRSNVIQSNYLLFFSTLIPSNGSFCFQDSGKFLFVERIPALECFVVSDVSPKSAYLTLLTYDDRYRIERRVQDACQVYQLLSGFRARPTDSRRRLTWNKKISEQWNIISL